MYKDLFQYVIRQVEQVHCRRSRLRAVHVDADQKLAQETTQSTEATVGNARWTVSPAAALRLPKVAFDVYFGLT